MEQDTFNSYHPIDTGLYWVGYNDRAMGLHSNPYLIVDGDEAVVLDGGSRPDFSTVMLKIMQTGVKPEQIRALIYHHYDPDLCGSISHFEELIGSKDLISISQRHNNVFIHHYGTTSKKRCINAMDNQWTFSSGRRLRFINTPYAHSPGSFVTWDETSGTLFSSDLFGSYSRTWALYLQLSEKCTDCMDYNNCPHGRECFMNGIIDFHRLIMTSEKALKRALDVMEELPVKRIAPQHGSVIEGEKDVRTVMRKLRDIRGIGVDGEFQGKIW